ncbi:unnamed protein product [Euphydryas editha]|uniref:Uncharacterized protein n=1 Tax=Euphydryas editha TaxID=104508 RepID=A0AAU9TT91_EUPED|nr:unnamed protein product [Euphydryas editha]
MDCFPVPVNNNSARKRQRNPETWKRNIAKVQRYSPKTLPKRPLCKHRKKFECLSISMRDIKEFHDGFYKFQDKSKQDAFILKHCSIKQTRRHRPTTGSHKPKCSQISYFMFSPTLKKRLKVCQNFFF